MVLKFYHALSIFMVGPRSSRANHCGESDLGQTATYKLDRVAGQLAYDEGIAANSTIVYECAARKF
jgi:hypothetical protein